MSPVGSPAENGAALLAAAAGIVDASASNPRLIFIEPGVYDVGTATLAMKPFVDITGSGRDVTTITGTGTAIYDGPQIGTVSGADNSELRQLTVKSVGIDNGAVAISNDGASPRLSDLAVVAQSMANSVGIYNQSSSATLTTVSVKVPAAGVGADGIVAIGSGAPSFHHVDVTVSGGQQNMGFYLLNTAATMDDVTVTAQGSGFPANGIFVDDTTTDAPPLGIVTLTNSRVTSSQYGVYRINGALSMKIFGSWISGTTNSIFIGDGEGTPTVQVGSTELDGAVSVVAAGTLTCASAYDANLVPLNATCQ